MLLDAPFEFFIQKMIKESLTEQPPEPNMDPDVLFSAANTVKSMSPKSINLDNLSNETKKKIQQAYDNLEKSRKFQELKKAVDTVKSFYTEILFSGQTVQPEYMYWALGQLESLISSTNPNAIKQSIEKAFSQGAQNDQTVTSAAPSFANADTERGSGSAFQQMLSNLPKRPPTIKNKIPRTKDKTPDFDKMMGQLLRDPKLPDNEKMSILKKYGAKDPAAALKALKANFGGNP